MLSKNKASNIAKLLKDAGIRPTRQRTALAAYLFTGKPKHVTAEMVYAATRSKQASISLATVYNNLHQFALAGLLREVLADHNFRYFDTTMREHYHFFDEDTGQLCDVPSRLIKGIKLPKVPAGKKISQVDVTIRLSKINRRASRSGAQAK